MRKYLILGLLVVALCFPATSYGEGAYIGIGGSYAVQNFDIETISMDGFTYDPDYDDTWGINAKIGYHFNDWFSLEADFDYFFSFELDDTVTVLGVPVNFTSDADIWTLMALAKFSGDFGPIKPFVIAGGGMMSAEADVTGTVPGLVSVTASDDETDVCAKLGLGIDFFVNENVSIGIEGSHVWGFNDLDEILYYNITLGLAYHF